VPRVAGPTYAQDTLYVRPSRRILGAEFGRDELRHVAFAALALTLIFAGAFATSATRGNFSALPSAFVLFLPFAAAAAGPAFLVALIAQKRVAEKQGCTTEFRVLPQWLLISVLFAFLFGFVFAAPGATSRFGNVTRDGAGRMSAAVPLAYTAIGFAALILALAVPGAAVGAPGLLLAFVAQVNGVLAAFSMIPVPGFAGSDIWRWSKLYFAAIMAGAVALYWASLVAVRLTL